MAAALSDVRGLGGVALVASVVAVPFLLCVGWLVAGALCHHRRGCSVFRVRSLHCRALCGLGDRRWPPLNVDWPWWWCGLGGCSVSAGWLVSMSVGLGGGVALVPALCRLAGSRYVFSKSARLALFRVWLAAPFLLCVSGLAVVVAALCRWWPLYWPLWVCCMVAPVLLSALAVFSNT